ncbi:MAG: 50S ribosomal protein L17 [Kiritimatiellia bacterium]
MRHLKRTIKLGRTSSHRDALLASLTCALIRRKRIQTTLQKAKAARITAEKMVTLGKKETLAARRQAMAKLHDPEAVSLLFAEIAPMFKDRQGGYTRIIKLGQRPGDNSQVAIIEWVMEHSVAAKKVKKSAAAKKDAAAEKAPEKKEPKKKAEKKPEKKADASEEAPAKKKTARKKKEE